MQKIKDIYLKNKEVINYLFFGVLTTIVNLIVKYILLFTILNAENAAELQLAVVISWIIACLFAYITNRKYVFESKSKEILKEMTKFFSARIATLGLEMLIMFVFVTALGLNSDIWVIVWTLVAQALVVITNYIFSKLIIFKNKEKEE